MHLKPLSLAASAVLALTISATAEARTIGAAVLISGNLDPADIVVVKAQVPGTVTGVP